MSFKRPSDELFRDIADAIVLIEQFTAGMAFETFRSNPMAVSAVERKLQIISEAAIRLGPEAETQCPDIPWRDIRGIGNQLRHAYERISAKTIWDTVKDDLPPLLACARNALDQPAPKPAGPTLG